MKNKILFMVLVSVTAVLVFVGLSVQKTYARDGGSAEVTKSPEPSETPNVVETPEPSKTPENNSGDRLERSLSGSPSVSSSVSPLAKSKDATELQSKAIEKINEAQSKLSELKLKLAKEVVTVPQNVQTLTDLADQKISDAKTALADKDFGRALGQAQSTEALAKNALRTLENEKEVEKVQSDLNKEIENEDISSIEVGTVASGSGSLKIEHKDKTRTTQAIPFSSTSAFQVQTDGGIVGVHVASGSQAVIDDGNIDIESDFPLTLNVASKTFSVKTPLGVREIKALPTESFSKIDKKDKPDSLSTVSLLQENGRLVFQANGSRLGKIFGLIPLTVSVKTAVDAETGAVVSIDKPWFINLLGPLFR